MQKFDSKELPPGGYALHDLTPFVTIRRYEEGNYIITKEDILNAIDIAQNVLDWVRGKISNAYLTRLQMPKKTEEERAFLIERVMQFIQLEVSPIKIIFIGSILGGNFDDISDIDMVIIFKDKIEADLARRKLYRAMRPREITHPLEMICVDENTYNEKSQVGGIFYTARLEGLSLPLNEG